MKDLDAASLDDVKQWFHDYYGAANVTVALVGDITPAIAKAKMLRVLRRHPGRSAGRAPAAVDRAAHRPRRATPCRTTSRRRASIANGTCRSSATTDETLLELAAAVLGGGKTSRLYERLVYRTSSPTTFRSACSRSRWPRCCSCRSTSRRASIRPRSRRRSPTSGRNSSRRVRARTSWRGSRSTRARRSSARLERVNGKATILAEGQVYQDDPAAYKIDLAAHRGGHAGQRARRRGALDRAGRLHADGDAGARRHGRRRRRRDGKARSRRAGRAPGGAAATGAGVHAR